MPRKRLTEKYFEDYFSASQVRFPGSKLGDCHSCVHGLFKECPQKKGSSIGQRKEQRRDVVSAGALLIFSSQDALGHELLQSQSYSEVKRWYFFTYPSCVINILSKQHFLNVPVFSRTYVKGLIPQRKYLVMNISMPYLFVRW